MKTYITKPKTIKKSQILGKEFSLSGKDYRFLKNNSNSKIISDFVEKDYTGKEIGSEAYMNKSKYRFLKTVNLGKNFTLETSKFEYCKPINKVYPKYGDILIAKDGGGEGLGESSIYNLENKEKTDSISAGIIGIRVNQQIKYYLFGFLKSIHFKQFVDLNTPQGSTIRHSKKMSLTYQIPFPTQANHENPQKVQDLVSVLVQNIIDKEEQIKVKNIKIDELIQKELKDNQKDNIFSYKLPRISEIKAESRLDTGLYEREYRTNIFLVQNYKNSYFKIPFKSLKTGQTPSDYYYPSNKVNSDVSLWLTPRNLNKNVLTERLWIHTQKPNTLKDFDIIFGSRGTVGDVYLYSEKDLGKAYINQSTTGITVDGDIAKKVFVLCYFSSSFFKIMLSKFVFNGTVPAITPDIFASFLIPSFPETKQQEIAKEYYNLVTKNEGLTLENYLEKEKIRNSQLGIFQLNMEIFELREKLEDLVDKIVNEEGVEIDFN